MILFADGTLVKYDYDSAATGNKEKFVVEPEEILLTDCELARKVKEIIKDNGTVNGKVNLIRKVTTPELGTTVEEIKTNPDKLVGRTITAKGFLSTSSKEHGADNFVGVAVKINNVKNTKGLDINKIEGLSLYGATRRVAEGEVLFNKGTKYKITKVNLIKDNWGDIFDYNIEADIIE